MGTDSHSDSQTLSKPRAATDSYFLPWTQRPFVTFVTVGPRRVTHVRFIIAQSDRQPMVLVSASRTCSACPALPTKTTAYALSCGTCTCTCVWDKVVAEDCVAPACLLSAPPWQTNHALCSTMLDQMPISRCLSDLLLRRSSARAPGGPSSTLISQPGTLLIFGLGTSCTNVPGLHRDRAIWLSGLAEACASVAGCTHGHETFEKRGGRGYVVVS